MVCDDVKSYSYWRNMLLWTFVKISRHIWLYTVNIMYQKQHIVHWKHRCRVGASNTRAACGPGRDFVRPAMLFGNLQIFNIYVAKCLEMRCREIIESNLNDTQCGFRPCRSNTDRISLSRYILRNFGSMLKTSSQLCGPRESIRPGSLWKALGSCAWARCWRPPLTGRHIFLLTNLCPFRES